MVPGSHFRSMVDTALTPKGVLDACVTAWMTSASCGTLGTGSTVSCEWGASARARSGSGSHGPASSPPPPAAWRNSDTIVSNRASSQASTLSEVVACGCACFTTRPEQVAVG